MTDTRASDRGGEVAEKRLAISRSDEHIGGGGERDASKRRPRGEEGTRDGGFIFGMREEENACGRWDGAPGGMCAGTARRTQYLYCYHWVCACVAFGGAADDPHVVRARARADGEPCVGLQPWPQLPTKPLERRLHERNMYRVHHM